jgi:hypothetical protein
MLTGTQQKLGVRPLVHLHFLMPAGNAGDFKERYEYRSIDEKRRQGWGVCGHLCCAG